MKLLQTAKNLATRAAKSYWASLENNAHPVIPGNLVTWRKRTGIFLDPISLFCYEFLEFVEFGDDTGLSKFLTTKCPELPKRFIERYTEASVVQSRDGSVVEPQIPVLFNGLTGDDLQWLDPLGVSFSANGVALDLRARNGGISLSVPTALIQRSHRTATGWIVTLRSSFVPDVNLEAMSLSIGADDADWVCGEAGLAWLNDNAR